MEIEDSDKTAGAIQKHRGTRHGWETAFAALFMEDEEGNGEVEEPIMKWLYGMMDNEEEALLMPSHDYDGNQAKFMEWMEKNRSAGESCAALCSKSILTICLSIEKNLS